MQTLISSVSGSKQQHRGVIIACCAGSRHLSSPKTTLGRGLWDAQVPPRAALGAQE